MGYRLFTNISGKTNSEGKIILPGGISIYLSRVGPGVFFALFGAIIVTASFYFGMTIVSNGNHEKKSPSDIDQPKEKYYLSYLGSGESIAQSRAHLQGDIVTMNRFMAELKSKSHNDKWLEAERAFGRIKVISMATVWGDDSSWGNFDEFKKWIQYGKGAPPEKIKSAADFFSAGLEDN